MIVGVCTLITMIVSVNSSLETLKLELLRTKRYKSDLSIIFFDINSFKIINDTLGHLLGDEVLVKISNIIENALKYSSKDIFIKIAKDSISITDFGIGISKEDLEQIDKKFYRASSNDWNNSLGLGLFIVKSILKLHNFELEIISNVNRGSTFRIHY